MIRRLSRPKTFTTPIPKYVDRNDLIDYLNRVCQFACLAKDGVTWIYQYTVKVSPCGFNLAFACAWLNIEDKYCRHSQSCCPARNHRGTVYIESRNTLSSTNNKDTGRNQVSPRFVRQQARSEQQQCLPAVVARACCASTTTSNAAFSC